MPTKFCNRPGCPELVNVPERLCARHQAANFRQQDQGRGTADERGYDADWRRFRAWFVSRHPLCADCLEENRYTPTAEVHHVIKLRDAPHLRLVEDNCRGLCRTHHSRRTAKGQ
jgi:5-methylcytosine-specific restriction protein A